MDPVLGEIVGWEALLVVLVIALLFGSSKLPSLARSLGEASREFKKGVSEHAPEAGDPEAGDEAKKPSTPPT
jgi:sec-independent protein translocase protein TatA